MKSNIDKNSLIKRTAPVAGNIPEELKALPQWICWKLEEDKDGDLSKIPFEPKTWSSFDQAVRAFEAAPSHCGIGFVFSSKDPFCGIDIDDCRNPKNGEISPGGKKILEHFPDNYAEISPSGTGIKIIIRGKLPGTGRKKGDVEVYDKGRYFTITGDSLNGVTTINDGQEGLDW